MADIRLIKLNEVFFKVIAERGIKREMSEHFSFKVPGYFHMPKYKKGIWDGSIKLLNLRTDEIYVGLLPYIKQFAEERDYSFEYDEDAVSHVSPKAVIEFSKIEGFTKELRDYQVKAIVDCINERRAIVLSPTSSGKSLIIYTILKWYGKKTLVIVPTINLVKQMAGDFIEYGEDEDNIYTITGGIPKQSDKDIIITTWQSVYKQDEEYFKQYEVILGDEVHGFKADALKSIMEKTVNAKFKCGFTGTLDESYTNEIVLKGLFGKLIQHINTQELIEQGHASDIVIHFIQLKYPKGTKKLIPHDDGKPPNYTQEREFIVSHQNRMKFLTKLLLKLQGNTICLYMMVDKHGKIIYNNFNDLDKNKTKKSHIVYDDIKVDVREEIRQQCETSDNNTIVASYGTFSTGVNIPSLKNLVFAAPIKAKIKVLQSIGRVLRKFFGKDKAYVYDICDDFGYQNYAKKHALARLLIYKKEGFKVKYHTVELEN